MDIKTLAAKLAKKYKTRDPFELASCLNIHVKLWPLNKDINGLYQKCQRNKFIYINKKLSYRQQMIVLAHEIGHAVLYKGLNVCFLEANTFFVKNKLETEANRFAVELLLSNEILHNYPSYFTIEQIASTEGIDVALLKLKL
ncbi:ImmA/IrrE family metallo-endopeptidase [Clostridium formicaceticum]|uniref:Metallopeptidase ImmA n=1 Tax=Clostridium formicaceticum TaxID=1497 RepID=A0AAC9WFS8_9CLOT|nr:ImmA/IrrE family metallo-endopeptidase [Clostridium formicaceticum]AOY76780.1 hypothetical protein BJL90_13510 [Clostridium formicaceticum]ARE87237.1 Metallopeptidase ImmA [Clostridium formicaceticum]